MGVLRALTLAALWWLCKSWATVFADAGKAIVANRILAAGTEPNRIAWGTGAGTAVVGDTTLFSESADETRATGSSSRVTVTITNDTYQVTGTMTAVTSPKTITNAGLFDAASGGNMLIKGDFTGIPLGVGDSIAFTIRLRLGN